MNVPGSIPVAIAPAQYPAAIQPSQIQILSGVSHSASRKKRTLASAAPHQSMAVQSSVTPRNPTDILEIFLTTQESESLRANTAAITSSLASLKDMPDCDQKRQIMNFAYAGLAANLQRLSSSSATASPDSLHEVVPQGSQSFRLLNCPICQDIIQFIPGRNVYVDATFTRCGHGFHIVCLQTHRQIGIPSMKNRCPYCRELLGSFGEPQDIPS